MKKIIKVKCKYCKFNKRYVGCIYKIRKNEYNKFNGKLIRHEHYNNKSSNDEGTCKYFEFSLFKKIQNYIMFYIGKK